MLNNQVILSGKVLTDFKFNHESHNERFYKTFIAISRASGNIDVIPIIVSDRIADIGKNYKDHNVQVIGQCRTCNYQEEHKQRKTLLVNIFASKFIVPSEEDSIKDSNELYLDGYLCKKPTYRKTFFGSEIADFVLAVNRKYGKTDYIPCVTIGEVTNQVHNAIVGDNLKIVGHIQSREYTKEIDNKQISNVAYEAYVTHID